MQPRGGEELFRGALAMHCSSVEQSGQNDARRLYRWLEHGSKAHLQQILSSSHAGVARQAHAKAASACSLMGGEELFRGALAMRCSSVEQSGQNDARRLYRWLEHGSKAHLQQVLSSRKPRCRCEPSARNTSRLIRRPRRVSTRRSCNSVPLPRALSDDPELACSATSTASTILTIPESDWAPISSLGLHWSPTRNTALYC